MMSATEHRITRADILSSEKFAAERTEFRRRLIPVKKMRRIEVSRSLHSISELRHDVAAGAGDAAHRERRRGADGELEAYNPLIPQGRELIATLMLEIEDPVRRNTVLLTLGGIENFVSMDVAGRRVKAAPTSTRTARHRTGKPPRCIGCASSSRRRASPRSVAGRAASCSRSITPITAIWPC